jgi:N6-L-threonylcarbamoyladenine synthase
MASLTNNTLSSTLSSKEKRKKFVGIAKTLDRGQYAVTYSPGGINGSTFQAHSGLPNRSQLFTVLGIESSCDDTGAAVVRSDGIILGESLASQHAIHEQYGGVVPSLAKNAHEENVDRVIAEAIERAGLSSVQDVDAIGVTVGPGLEICLRVGCNKARDLALRYNKPFVGVHHLEAHILMARLPVIATTPSLLHPPARDESTVDDMISSHLAVQFPFLALLVSGGHCLLLKCIGIGRYQVLGGTIDDSLGR